MISSALSWRKWKKKCGAGEVPFRRAAVRPVPRRHWLNLRCRCPEGAWRFRSPADLAFSLLPCPHPPDPLPLRGRGGLRVILCKGLRPLHPRGLYPRFAAKTAGGGSLRAAPAAKERGDRGRGTSAFEMVLSPGAGIASAARGKPPCPRRVPERHPSPPRKGQSPTPGNTAAGSVSAARVQPRGCKGRSPLHKKTLSLPLPAGKGGGGMGAETKLK